MTRIYIPGVTTHCLPTDQCRRHDRSAQQVGTSYPRIVTKVSTLCIYDLYLHVWKETHLLLLHLKEAAFCKLTGSCRCGRLEARTRVHGVPPGHRSQRRKTQPNGTELPRLRVGRRATRAASYMCCWSPKISLKLKYIFLSINRAGETQVGFSTSVARPPERQA